MRHETEKEFGHITEDCFVNGDNRSGFLERAGAQPHILYLWHKADSDCGVLGNMLQVLGVAVAVDCENIRTDCSEVNKKRKAMDVKTEEEVKAQIEFRRSVSSALVGFAMNESVAAYAAGNKEMREAEVEIDNLEDLIEEAKANDYERKLEHLKKRLKHWRHRASVLEDMLMNTSKPQSQSTDVPTDVAVAVAVEDQEEDIEEDIEEM